MRDQQDTRAVIGLVVAHQDAATGDGRLENGMLAPMIVEGIEACLHFGRLLVQHRLGQPVPLAHQPGVPDALNG